MKMVFIPLLISLTTFIACNKNNASKPVISIESINSVIPVGGSLDATLKFTDNSADLGRGTFIAIRNRLNQRPLPIGTSSADTLIGPIPDFPDKSQGQFHYTLDYNYLKQSDQENDTIMFKFAVIDRIGNKSDTISTGRIVVLH